MLWRLLPSLTLVLLGLVLAAPLSSGDKGLWLSVAPTAVLLADAPVGRLPAEHSTLLQDRQARLAVAGRVESSGSDKGLGTSMSPACLTLGDCRIPFQEASAAAVLLPITALAAPRAPPA
jgi:hypothetical protein